jgi:hypothetical protein
MIVTMYTSLVDTKTPHYRDIYKVFELIKAGGRHGEIVDKIRTAKDKEDRERLKRSLPITLFSGKFKERKHDSLIEYNKLVCLDLDNLKNIDVRRFELEQLPFVFACWTSPSGVGLKVLVKVLTENHLGHFLALSKEIKGVDPSGKDICRATFLSKDEKIYINKNSTVYDKIIMPSFTDEQKYENLKKWVEGKGSYFVNGNRNSFITKLSSAANRFGVDREFLKGKLEEEFLRGSDFSRREMENTVNGIYQRYQDQFNSVSADEVWTDDKISQVLSDEVKTSDVIYLRDVAVDIVKDYDEGVSKGPTTYFPSIDKIFRRVPGQLNTLIGIGNHGKSIWQQQLDIADAINTGGKFGYFGPEGYPAKRWYRQLIHALVGKGTSSEAKNRMSKEELNRAMEFINTHFIYVYPPLVPTPEYIIERFIEAIIKHGLKGVTIDPWNQLLHSMAKRDDVYLAEALTKFERFIQQHQVLGTVIAHPNRTSKGEDGNYEAPDIYDINGGPVWNARSTNICTYHRPYYTTNPNDTTCEVIYRKIKDQEIMGIPGTVTLQYDRNTFRFYDNGFSPLTNFKL